MIILKDVRLPRRAPAYRPYPERMSFCLTADHLAAMAHAGLVVVSPHFDDACFSVGGLLHVAGSGELVNVFNRSTYLARPPAHLSGPVTEEEVARLRDAEDQAFAQRCGLRRTALGGAEPGFFDRRPNALEFVAQDIDAMQAPLMDALRARAPATGRRAYLLAPMAVGRHVNHHAVHAIVARHRQELEPHFHLCFYEDLPYANDPLQRAPRVRAFTGDARWSGWQRGVYSPGWAIKQELVSLYATQLKRPAVRWKFRPASVWPWAVHEALWMDTDARSALNP